MVEQVKNATNIPVMTPCLVLVISLVRATERRTYITQALKKMGIENYTLVDAVDAQTLSKEEKNRYYRPLYGLKRLSASEIACAASHKRCYELLAQSNAQAALILEDDAKLHADLPKIIQHIDRFPNNWTLVYACKDTVRPEKWPITLHRPKQVTNHYALGIAVRKYTGSYGYFISKPKAVQLRDTLFPITKPIDNTLFSQRLTSWGLYNFYCLRPALIDVSIWDAQNYLGDRKRTIIPLWLQIYLGIKYFIYNFTLYQVRRFVPTKNPF